MSVTLIPVHSTTSVNAQIYIRNLSIHCVSNVQFLKADRAACFNKDITPFTNIIFELIQVKNNSEMIAGDMSSSSTF